jgi:hypothetical protein
MKTVLDWMSDNPGMTVIILIFVIIVINILR